MPYLLLALFFVGLWLVIEHLLPPLVASLQGLLRAGIRRLLGLGVFERMRVRARGRLAPLERHLPVIAILAAGIAVSLATGAMFLDLAEALHENSPVLQSADEAAHAWAEFVRYDAATVLFVALTILGTPVGLGILVALVAGFHIARHQPRLASYLVVTTVTGGILNLVLKDVFERSRPDLSIALRHASGYSFPSGHAMGATIVFGALAYLAYRSRWSWRLRSATMAVCATLAAGIAFSRIYLGVHWISDIAAGITAGAVWTIASIVAYETFRRLRALRAQERGPNRPGSGSEGPESTTREGAGAP